MTCTERNNMFTTPLPSARRLPIFPSLSSPTFAQLLDWPLAFLSLQGGKSFFFFSISFHVDGKFQLLKRKTSFEDGDKEWNVIKFPPPSGKVFFSLLHVSPFELFLKMRMFWHSWVEMFINIYKDLASGIASRCCKFISQYFLVKHSRLFSAVRHDAAHRCRAQAFFTNKNIWP